MKKIIARIVAAALLMSCLTVGAAFAEKKINIVTTIFPVYDWVRAVAGDTGAEITMLLDSGVDLHSYQPTAQDIMKVATCDLFVYVGGESDEWAEGALAQSVNPDQRVVNLVEAMGGDVKLEETVEGMQAEDEEEEEDEVDEHVWLSLRNAQKLVGAIAGALSEIDPENANAYAANRDAYLDELAALDAAYAEAVAGADFDTLLFCDRFPFRYLADDYGLNYYAAFSGCSAESEASFETVVFLAGKVDELGLRSVLTIEGSTHRIAETVINTTQTRDQKALVLDSLQSATAGDAAAGKTYLGAMADNLAVLTEALSK